MHEITIKLTAEEQARVPEGMPCKKPLKLPTVTERIRVLSVVELGKLVFYSEQYIMRAPATRAVVRAAQEVLECLIEKVVAVGNASLLPSLFTRKFCTRLVEYAGDHIEDDHKTFLRLPPVAAEHPGRTVIKSDILSSVRREGMSTRRLMRRAHMADRLGLFFLVQIAVKGDGFHYEIAQTFLQLGNGNKEAGTNANHCSGLTSLSRRPVGDEAVAVSRAFLVDWFLSLSMNRTFELPRKDNEVDMKLEPTMRPIMVREVNRVARGEDIEACFLRAVLDIKRLITNLKAEWNGNEQFAKKLKGLVQQEAGLDDLLVEGRIDSQFYRMMSRLVTPEGLKALVNAVPWDDLSGEQKTSILDSIKDQIHTHSARPFLAKRSPTLLAKLAPA